MCTASHKTEECHLALLALLRPHVFRFSLRAGRGQVSVPRPRPSLSSAPPPPRESRPAREAPLITVVPADVPASLVMAQLGQELTSARPRTQFSAAELSAARAAEQLAQAEQLEGDEDEEAEQCDQQHGQQAVAEELVVQSVLESVHSVVAPSAPSAPVEHSPAPCRDPLAQLAKDEVLATLP